MESKRIEYKDRICWRNERGEFHCLDGPVIELNNGDKYWCVNGKRHREDGPAIEFSNGGKQWYINGERHREDGPAVEWSDGDEWWILNNRRYTEEQWKEEVIKIKLKRIKQYGFNR